MTKLTKPGARARLGHSLFGALAAAALSSTAGIAQDMPDYQGIEDIPEMSLRVSEPYSQGEASGRAAQAYADYVNAASKGRIKIEIYWSGSLFPAPESAEGIASGLADLGGVTPIYNPASFPIANWLTTIANQATIDNRLGVSAFDSAATEFFYTDAEIKKEFEERGLHIIGASGSFGFDMLCTSPLKTLADFKGKRVRTAGQVFAREAEALGMVPVPLVPAEMYEAFQRGIVDCAILHPPGYNNFGLMTVAKDKYFINLGFSGFLSAYYCMNKDKWDALPPVAQQILIDGWLVLRQNSQQGVWGEIQKFSDQVKAGEATGVQPDKEVLDTLAAFQQQDLELMATTAPPTVADPKASVDRFLGLIQKWRGLLESELGWAPVAGNDMASRIASWDDTPDYGQVVALLRRELAKATPAQ